MHKKRVVLLIDNLGLVLALNKGRSSRPRIARICCAFAALSLASGTRFVARWVPSELNPADAPSRRFEKKGKASPARPDCKAPQGGSQPGGRECAAGIMHEPELSPESAHYTLRVAGERHRPRGVGAVRPGIARVSLVAALAGSLASPVIARSGLVPGEVLRRTLAEYGPVCCWREDSGGVWSPDPVRAWPPEHQIPWCKSGPQGLEADLPMPDTGASALLGDATRSRIDATSVPATDGPRSSPRIQRIPPALGAQRPQERSGRGASGVRGSPLQAP